MIRISHVTVFALKIEYQYISFFMFNVEVSYMMGRRKEQTYNLSLNTASNKIKYLL